MQIDGFTVIAQILNFLLLAVLLRLVLYKPVTRVMADRTAAIEARWAEAEVAQAEGKAEAAKHRQALQRLDAERADIVTAARHEAEQEHRRMLQAARSEAKEAQQEWRAALLREQADFAIELRQQVAAQICSVAKRAIVDLADAQLEAQIIVVFIGQLRELEAAVRREMGEACRNSGIPIVVRTGFEVPAEDRPDLEATITALLGGETGRDGLPIDWVAESGLGCGIQLETPGRQVRWSLDSYVDEVEQEVIESLRLGAAVG